MKTKIELGKPCNELINNTDSMCYSVVSSVVSSVSISVTNSVWSSVRDSINIPMRWRINL